MKRFILLAVTLLLGFALFLCPLAAFPQASPYSNTVFKAQVFTASGQTGTAIQLNGLVVSSTVGSSFASGAITLTGSSLSTVTFSVQGSSDNGATFYTLPVNLVTSPGAYATAVTATANGLYQVNLAGLTHVRFVTSGTFAATNVSITLTASPNGQTAKGGGGGGASYPGVTSDGASGLAVSGNVAAANLIAASLPLSTSPACPNGAGGALTTNGCATGGGNSGHVAYQSSFWADLSAFTQAGSQFSVVNNQIAVTGTGGTFATNYLAINASNNDDQEVDFEVTFQVAASQPGGAFCGGGQNYGIAIGKLGMSQFTTNSVQVFLAGENSPIDTLSLQYNGAAISGSPGVANPTCIAPGDIVRMVYSQRVNVITGVYDNITQGTHNRVTFTSQFIPGTTQAVPNSSKFAVWNLGGAYTILNMRVFSRQPPTPRLAFLGDSKTWGAFAGAVSQRFASQFAAYGPVAVYAGTGDVTGDLLADMPYILLSPPQYAVLCIGYNDKGWSVPSATWQAHYRAIVSQLKAAGVHVIHMLSIPANAGVDVTELNAWILSTYASDNIIDPSIGWSNTLYLSSDNVHPNALGHAFVASRIRSYGYIPLPATAAPEYEAPATSALYPAPAATSQSTPTPNAATITSTAPASASCATDLGPCNSSYGTVLITPNGASGGIMGNATWATVGHSQSCSAYQMGGSVFHSTGGYTSAPDNGATTVALASGSPGSESFYLVYQCH